MSTTTAFALINQLATALIACDELLREIRAENMDGSEDAVGAALERSYEARLIVAKLDLHALPEDGSLSGQLLAALQACAPYTLAALRDGDAAAADASSKAATAITAALIHRATNAPAETAAEELANAVRSALADGPAGYAAELKAGLSSRLELDDQLYLANRRIAELESELRLQVDDHQQTVTQCEEARFGQLQALLKLETACLRPMPDVDYLSNIIREVDGNNSLGAGALAEAILSKLDGWAMPLGVSKPVQPQALDVVLDSLFPGKWDRHTRDNWRAPVAKAMCKALPHLFAGMRGEGIEGVLHSLHGSPVVNFTLPQVLELLSTFGGDNAEVAVQSLPARTVGEDQLPAGLYAHFTDCPEEGTFFLGDHDPDIVVEAGKLDATLITYLTENCLDLRCVSTPTGGGDAEVEWVVIEHHQAEPHDREIGRASSPRKAITAARSSQD